MNPAHTPKKTKQSEIKSAQQSNFEIQTEQPLSLHAGVLQMQRTIGNRATVQRLKNASPLAAATEAVTEADTMTEHATSHDVQGPIQRATLMTGDAMLEIAPYTTNLFGKKKSTAYNTLVDALKAYWEYAGGTKRDVSPGITKRIDAVLAAANAWWTKHGASTKAADAVKQAAVHKTRVAANKLKKDISDARDKLIAESTAIDVIYNTPALWAMVTDWSNNVWHLEENTNFYTSVRTFTTVEQGKEIIAKHLLDHPVGRYPMSPELFNVSGPLFNRAGALIGRPNTELTVADFQSLFAASVAAAGQIWGDLISKSHNDSPQGTRDSFLFQYTRANVPDITG